MHNSQGELPMDTGSGMGPHLLRSSDPSSICLNCHTGPGGPSSPSVSSTDGSAMTPGGDFYWLTKTFVWADGESPGERHGHNIVASDFGYLPDSTNSSAPGGTYPAMELGCTSCHDPHFRASLPISGSGSYGGDPPPGTVLGPYRLLAGAGYDGALDGYSFSFAYDPPVARANPLQPYGEDDLSHVDYGSSMSEWCANCHPDVLRREHQLGPDFEHPSGNRAGLRHYRNRYNSYLATGDMSGSRETAYWALVPFERGLTDPNLLDPTSTMGPGMGANIACITCHRAHASAFLYGLRWDITEQLVADSHPGYGDIGVTGNDVLYSYYGRDMVAIYGPNQRVLCEKCHDVPKDGYPPGW
jgi:hypothetical protein